jgi:hypothetical protein
MPGYVCIPARCESISRRRLNSGDNAVLYRPADGRIAGLLSSSIRSKLSQLQVDCNCMENHADGISMLDVITCIATPHRGRET